ncbi:hypothetical protein COBT_000437 [Conglomerata obtusa]
MSINMKRNIFPQDQVTTPFFIEPITKLKIPYHDELVQYYFLSNQLQKLDPMYEPVIPITIQQDKSDTEIVIDIVEELYVNKECLVDGYVYIKRGFNKNMVIEIEQLDCYGLKGYVDDGSKRSETIHTQNFFEKQYGNKIEECKKVQDDDKSKNNNDYNKKIALDEFKNLSLGRITDINEFKHVKKSSSIHNTTDDSILNKLNSLNVRKSESENIKRYFTRDNLFLSYQRKNINLVNVIYSFDMIKIEVKENLDYLNLNLFVNENVYDVECDCKIGTYTFENDCVKWKFNNVKNDTYEILIKRFGFGKDKLISIEYKNDYFQNTGIDIKKIINYEKSNVYIKKTFSVIKYEIKL